jgi:hypothetical protein
MACKMLHVPMLLLKRFSQFHITRSAQGAHVFHADAAPVK